MQGLFNDKILAAILFVYVCPSLIKLQAEWLPVPSFSLRPNSRHYDRVEFLRKCLLGAVSWKCRQNNNLSRKYRQKCAHFVLWTGLQFRFPLYLNFHIRHIHTLAQKPCPVCKKEFRQISLPKHIEQVHGDSPSWMRRIVRATSIDGI